jgi:hypothetical protein
MLDGSVCATDKYDVTGTKVETKNTVTKRHLYDDVDGKFTSTLQWCRQGGARGLSPPPQ